MIQKENELVIENYEWDSVDANSWLLVENNCGLLIDAVDNANLYKRIQELDDLMILLTHSHFDHICGLNQIRKIKSNVIVCSTEQCSMNIGNKYKNISASANAFMSFYKGGNNKKNIEPIECEPAEKTFNGNINLSWQKHNIQLLACYGHSNDSMIILLDNQFLFTGDTILSIPTVTRFPGGSTERFWKEDIPLLQKMDVTKVYPGHGKPGTLDQMIEQNKIPEKYVQKIIAENDGC